MFSEPVWNMSTTQGSISNQSLDRKKTKTKQTENKFALNSLTFILCYSHLSNYQQQKCIIHSGNCCCWFVCMRAEAHWIFMSLMIILYSNYLNYQFPQTNMEVEYIIMQHTQMNSSQMNKAVIQQYNVQVWSGIIEECYCHTLYLHELQKTDSIAELSLPNNLLYWKKCQIKSSLQSSISISNE